MKIYDCFIFFNELDLLEIRLTELDPVVDYFVLVEAEMTFSGKPKDLIYRQNKDRFSKWQNKIIHLVAPKGPFIKSGCDISFQRNWIRAGLGRAQPEDLVLISDADEIPHPERIASWGHESGNRRLRQTNHYYWINCLSSCGWCGTVMGERNSILSLSPEKARHAEFPVLEDAGWHFSYLGGYEGIKTKLESYNHQEVNTPAINNREHIENSIARGADLFGRDITYKIIPIDHTFPKAIQNNQIKYQHLIKYARIPSP